jgi:hypothetical protein
MTKFIGLAAKNLHLHIFLFPLDHQLGDGNGTSENEGGDDEDGR